LFTINTLWQRFPYYYCCSFKNKLYALCLLICRFSVQQGFPGPQLFPGGQVTHGRSGGDRVHRLDRIRRNQNRAIATKAQ